MIDTAHLPGRSVRGTSNPFGFSRRHGDTEEESRSTFARPALSCPASLKNTQSKFSGFSRNSVRKSVVRVCCPDVSLAESPDAAHAQSRLVEIPTNEMAIGSSVSFRLLDG